MKKKVVSRKSVRKSPHSQTKIAKKPRPSLKAESSEADIIELIVKDHKPLKRMVKILKDPDIGFTKKRPVFEEFAALLLGHANSEEESLYIHMKNDKNLRMYGHEGVIEHTIAKQLIDESIGTDYNEEWLAKVKVLAEIIEHHIEEEETEMFDCVRKYFDMNTRRKIGDEYLKLKEEFQNPTPAESPQNEDYSEIRAT